MNLFLAQFNLRVREYMREPIVGERHLRLVEAADEEEARKKLTLAEELDDPYGVSVSVEHLVIYPVIR